MNNKVYVVIKLKDQNNNSVEYKYRPFEINEIYDKMMEITNGNHEVSSEVESWCDLATIGEIRELPNFEVEITEL